MNSLEKVLKAINHEETKEIPVYPILSGVTRNLNGASYYDWATNAEICADALIKAQEMMNTDLILTLTDLSVEASDFGQEIIYPENEAAHPNFDNYFIKDVNDYDRIIKIDPRKTPRMSEHIKLCKLLVDRKGKDVPIVAFVFGPLGILSMLRGQSNLYLDLYDCPDIVKKAVDTITNVLIDYCDALIETGISAIMLDTLFASQTIMSKEMWLEFEGEYVERLAEFIHQKGKMVMIHNCGGGIYFDVQIEKMKPEGISYLHLPDDCSSLEELKEKYGDKTTLIGMIDPAWIVNATTEEIRKECEKQIEILGKGGGFILATGCEYPANLDLKAAKTMVEVAKSYRK
ncbi:MAG TPA: uroporphyrinogen decarboxylase [Acholeplasmataceae bacterium]|nr:uroporphyrinogen decarboxylase [Acholeplasmataceae bacterium]